MGKLSFAMDKPTALASHGQNVVLFDPKRRASRARAASTDQPHLSEGVVVYWPLANGESRHKTPRAEASISKKQAGSSNTSEPRLTTFDWVATTFLILSVFSGPALVWTILRSASLG
jgi:hypothetical protein